MVRNPATHSFPEGGRQFFLTRLGSRDPVPLDNKQGYPDRAGTCVVMSEPPCDWPIGDQGHGLEHRDRVLLREGVPIPRFFPILPGFQIHPGAVRPERNTTPWTFCKTPIFAGLLRVPGTGARRCDNAQYGLSAFLSAGGNDKPVSSPVPGGSVAFRACVAYGLRWVSLMVRRLLLGPTLIRTKSLLRIRVGSSH